MDSKKNTTTDVGVMLATLTQKVLQLQEKLDALCKSTGNPDLVQKVHLDFTSKKGVNSGADINTFREKE